MVDLDSWKWWCLFFHRIGQDVGILSLWFKEELKDLVKHFFKEEAENLIERRHAERRMHMNYVEVGARLLKILSDAKAAEQSPAGAKLIADIEAFYKDEIEPNQPPTEAKPPTMPE